MVLIRTASSTRRVSVDFMRPPLLDVTIKLILLYFNIKSGFISLYFIHGSAKDFLNVCQVRTYAAL